MNYTDSVLLALREKREKILTFGPLEVLFTSPSKHRDSGPQGKCGRGAGYE